MLRTFDRDRWVRTLRNPNRKQATGSLATRTDEYNPYHTADDWSYCCLGVYCAYILGTHPSILGQNGLPHGVATTKLNEVLISLENLTGVNLSASTDVDIEYLKHQIAEWQFEDDLADYEFDFYNYISKTDPPEYRFKRGAEAFAFMNDTLKWSFDRIATVLSHLPTKEY